MLTPESIDQRINDLEIKASFSEELVDQLNAIVTRQQTEIAALIREVQQLRALIPGKDGGGSGLLQELPPQDRKSVV